MDGLKTKKIDVDKADLKQLRWFATAVLSLDMTGKENLVTMRLRVKEAWPRDEIFLPEVADFYPDKADSDGRAPGRAFETEFPPGSGRMRKCMTVQIPEMDPTVYPGGDEPVPLSVNGSAIYVPRGEPQVVPVEYVEVLANAKKFVYAEYDPNKDGGRGGLKPPQIVQEYPFNYA